MEAALGEKQHPLLAKLEKKPSNATMVKMGKYSHIRTRRLNTETSQVMRIKPHKPNDTSTLKVS